ncbi:MAG: transglutaminase family protein, partial [Planctomycetota bacterium]|nr:transglutaminase family protein [Planctomycetota bacterium]
MTTNSIGLIQSHLKSYLALCAICYAVAPSGNVNSQDANSSLQDKAEKSLASVGTHVQKSVVQIAMTDQQGKPQSVGTGFAAIQKGLIVTNLHVIGEGRSFVLKNSEGNPLTVTEVVASDRFVDLAILRIKETHLKPLKLADYTQVKKGQPFVAIGHPQGLENSMVQGVISSKRNIDGRQMLQVAMPVEAGNSGGPLVNAAGDVVGVVTLKSLATNNIGFAIGSDQIQKLIDQPNPVPISRWLTIGVLRSDIWKPQFGASWRQKGGRILSHSAGEGFGGRALCLYQKPVPQTPFELEVEVKLDDESGAAGLAFKIDDQGRHYGFYPSNQNLRFSRFEGSTPYQWSVLYDQPTVAYKPGRWNRLKVRIEKDKIIAFVNNTRIGEFNETKLQGIKIGLAKFRETRAEFRNFRVGQSLTRPGLSTEQKSHLVKNLAGPLSNLKFEDYLKEAKHFPKPSQELILDHVNRLESKIDRLKLLADAVHVEQVKQNFAKVIDQKKEQDIDLILACLWIARLDDPDHEINGHLDYFESLAKQLLESAKKVRTDEEKIAVLNRFLFERNGFHGSRHDYYRPENSYISHVLEDREGIPITLSILYIEFAKRLGLAIDGIGLPGHFLVAHNRPASPPQLIDV